MSDMRWMRIMGWFTEGPYRPLILIILAQNNGEPLDEINLATRAGLLHQQMTGEVVETAVMVKQITDLDEGGYVERAADGFRWRMTDLGTLVSRQWAPGQVEPRLPGPLEQEEVRGWRDRVIEFMDHDADLAESAGIPKDEWIMTQSQRLVEMHVLNRVLGEEKLPEWLVKMHAGPGEAGWPEDETEGSASDNSED